jgi:muramidase (phage lysozyme)
MDATVPPGAAILLDFISVHESRGSYDVIYGNHQTSLPHPITTMTLDQLLTAQIHWGKEWGSSAAGRYQIVQTTLAGLKKTLGLGGSEVFSPDLQDRLGFQLLKQRGYVSFMARILTMLDFGKLLAEEWASLPVLAPTQGAHKPVQRGDTYYAGDGINKALVTPVQFEGALTRAHAASA